MGVAMGSLVPPLFSLAAEQVERAAAPTAAPAALATPGVPSAECSVLGEGSAAQANCPSMY